MGRRVRETAVEKALKEAAENADGHCLKLTGYKGIPDRLVFMPGGIIVFVETKNLTGTLATAQRIWSKRIKKMGFAWAAPRTSEEAKHLIHTLTTEGD